MRTRIISKTVILKKKVQAFQERVNFGKAVLFVASLYLFLLAITLMKEGARGIAPWLQDVFSIDNAANSLGFGWLFSYLIMSGSPVAASALTFYDVGAIDKLGSFAMIIGSRIGASFIVLFTGFLYVLRGQDRAASLSMGLLSLTVTATTYLPSFFVGFIILNKGWADSWHINSGEVLTSILDAIINPVVNPVTNLFQEWAVFIVGLGAILVSFNLFDRCLPEMSIKESQFGRVSRLVYHPAVMFVLGGFVTTISMSVTLSLSILVPLSARGLVRRENVIPYIMGANITTFVDTLLASAMMENPDAFTIVLVGMVSITIVSLVILLLFHHVYRHMALKSLGWTTASNRNMAFFILSIFIIPLILLGL